MGLSHVLAVLHLAGADWGPAVDDRTTKTWQQLRLLHSHYSTFMKRFLMSMNVLRPSMKQLQIKTGAIEKFLGTLAVITY